MSPCPTVMSSATTMNRVVSAAWLIWGMIDSCDGVLGGAGFLNGAGVGEGLSVAEAVAPLPVFTHALLVVLAGVPHQDLTAALSLPVAACCSLLEALVSSSLRAVAILLLCCLSSLCILAW